MIASVYRQGGWGLVPALILSIVLALAVALVPLPWAVLGLLGGIAVLGTLIEPRIGLVLVVLAVPFGTLREVQIAVVSIGLTEAALALTLVAWLARLMARREMTESGLRLPPLVLPLSAFVGALLLSLLGTFSLQHSIKEILKWLEVLVVYVLVALGVDTRWRKVLLLAVVMSGCLAALHGIYQFLFRVGPEEFVLFGRFMRAYGTFEQPNPYGGYLGLTVPLTVGLLMAAIVRPDPAELGVRWPTGLVALTSGALMVVALVMSWSRGAWLGFGAGLGIMAVAIVVSSRRAVLGVVLAAVVGYILLAGGLVQFPPALLQRFRDFVPYFGVRDVRGVEVTDANFPVLERLAHWQTARQMWTDHPWLGVGAGNYEPIYPRYALPLWSLPLGHAHNYYLNIAAEAGVVGLGTYLLVWSLAFVQAWRRTRHRSGWDWAIALGVLGVLAHLSVHNFFDNLYVHGMYLHVAILLGLLYDNGA